MSAGIELTQLRIYRELASQLLYTIVHEVNNYSVPFPQRKASFLVVVSMTKSLLMHYKQDHITKKLGKTQNELMKFLDSKNGKVMTIIWRESQR